MLDRGILLLPAVEPGSGPFPGRPARWTEARLAPGERAAAVSFYLALMTATCLELIGAEGPTVLEGPFTANAAYRRMLAAATGRPVLRSDAGSTGTSLGAALLAMPTAPPFDTRPDAPDPDAARLAAYAAAWRARL